MYQSIDALLVRAAVHSVDTDLPSWPDLVDDGPDAPYQWCTWLRKVWARESFADAITVASPVLAHQIGKVCDGHCRDSRAIRRTVMSTARYLLRMTGRSTPFGLFAGATAAALGPRVVVRWGGAHRPVARPGSGWLAALVTDLETYVDLLRRLPVVVDSPRIQRDDRLVVPLRRRAGGRDGSDDTTVLVDVSLRRTGAVEAVVRYTQSPILVQELIEKLIADSPGTSPTVIETTVADLVRLGFLRTGLRPAMTVTDPLEHVVTLLNAVGAGTIPQVAARVRELRALRDGIARHNHTTSPTDRRHQRRRLAEQIEHLSTPTGQPLTVDLRLDADIMLPTAVAREAAAAATALTQLTPFPTGLPMWEDFHGAFLERYGTGAIVPLLELVNPDTGLGLPATYRGSVRTATHPALSGRDERLLRLAQTAAVRGAIEVTLDGREIDILAGGSAARQVPPHVEVFVQVHATSRSALQRGDFELLVTGAARAAGATTGRFLDLLDPASRRRFRDAYGLLPTGRAGALPAQMSCPPLQAESETLARAPRMLPTIISVAEYREPDGDTVALDDLAVGGDTDGLYLISQAGRRLIESTVLNAVEFRYHSHPLLRFLCEISAARAAVYMPFSWGAASSLPFLPRLRYGRIILAPARWTVSADDLPKRHAPWPQWHEALGALRGQIRLPDLVHLVEADNRLPLDLARNAHLALLRAHLDRHGHARLDEAPPQAAYGWLDGHAHEIVVPLAAAPGTAPPAAGRKRGQLVRPAHVQPVARDHGHLPGASPWLYAKLYSHPDRTTDILHRIPDLIAQWDSPPAWWFVPYHDPEPHLRLRLRLDGPTSYGAAAHHLGAWASSLRAAGLLGRVQLDTYHPETGRYGHGDAMTAAEAVFAADSAAALSQLRIAARTATPLDAITVAGLVDLTASFVGTPAAGMRWLIDDLAHEPTPAADRTLRDATIRLADPRDDWAALRALPSADHIRHAWQQRRAALATYRERLTAQRDPLSVLSSLLHMHHVRMLGIDSNREQLGRALARATALRWTATTTQGTR
nr:lantibiotic dehydratase [Protofrankia symbiont of Coriaria ruscifolia]